MSRLAKRRPVYFWEEPKAADGAPRLDRYRDGDVTVLTPRTDGDVRPLLDAFVDELGASELALWYYTPMALEFSGHLSGHRIYDCMDELSLFKGASPELARNERELLRRASIVFTGGRSLYYAKRRVHRNAHCFPSAVDAAHFSRVGHAEPADLAGIPHPRVGFYGVIDERFDPEYVRELSERLPEWNFIFLGPVIKIDERDLPRAQNIHYLGMKSYAELPAYLEHWDVAFLPFALNDATRFISPTKTLEYLAAKKPVISTPIADVVDPYGKDGLVAIAETPKQGAQAARNALETPPGDRWHAQVDALLQRMSWDATVDRMRSELDSLSSSPSVAAL